jgi:hypothetical protein
MPWRLATGGAVTVGLAGTAGTGADIDLPAGFIVWPFLRGQGFSSLEAAPTEEWGPTMCLYGHRNPKDRGPVIYRILDGAVSELTTLDFGPLDTYRYVWDMAFDGVQGTEFGSRLYVAYVSYHIHDPKNQGVYRVEPSGEYSLFAPFHNGPTPPTALAFSPGTRGGHGLYTFDGNISGGEHIHRVAPDGHVTRWIDNVTGKLPGAANCDGIRMAFDPSGGYAWGLYHITGQNREWSTWRGIARYGPDGSVRWFVKPAKGRLYHDLAFGKGVGFGRAMYVTAPPEGAILAFGPDGSSTVFATGFQSPTAITFSRDGAALFVQDAKGIWAITAS